MFVHPVDVLLAPAVAKTRRRTADTLHLAVPQRLARQRVASASNKANLMLDEPQLRTRMRLGCGVLIVMILIVMPYANWPRNNIYQRFP
jgi:hypothetical protein